LILNVLDEISNSAIQNEDSVAISDSEVAIDVVDLAVNEDNILGH